MVLDFHKDAFKREDYTSEELNYFEKLKNELIIWMFNSPNNTYPITEIIKRAFDYGKGQSSEQGVKNG